MKVLITGISGQDGSYLAEQLVGLGDDVHGMVRRHSVAENQSSRLNDIYDDVTLHYGDLTDRSSIDRIMRKVQPDHIYNLGAMSHVRISYDMPEYTMQTNTIGVLNMLESMRAITPRARFYQASSSEMFGNQTDPSTGYYQTLDTPMVPVSPYGVSKVAAHNLVHNYRNAYGLNARTGILFNHESPRRGTNFVTNKVVQGAVAISLGLQDKLALGNLDSERDWGHAKDYVRAMRMIMQADDPDDWIVATGVAYSVRDLCDITFKKLNMDYNEYVVIDPRYVRPEELHRLCGDASRTHERLGWKPYIDFDSMIGEMIEFWQKEYINR